MMSPRRNGLRPTSSGRTSMVPSPRPWAMTGMPPRSSRDGTMFERSDTSSTRRAPVSRARVPIRSTTPVPKNTRVSGRNSNGTIVQ